MSSQAATPSPVLFIRPSKGLLRLNLKDVWEYRELLYFLVWRDIKVRYKQTALGALWAVIQPVMTMVVFSIFFRKAGRPETILEVLPKGMNIRCKIHWLCKYEFHKLVVRGQKFVQSFAADKTRDLAVMPAPGAYLYE